MNYMITQSNDIGFFFLYFAQLATLSTNIIIFTFFIFKILKREKNWINYQFLGFQILITSALLINLIENIISGFFEEFLSNSTSIFLFGLVILLYFLSPIFLVTFSLSFINSLKTRDLFSKKIQVSILIIYSIILSFKFLIPDGITGENNGITMNLTYFIYIMIVLTIGTIIPLFYFSIGIINKHFEEKRLKNKWILVVIGMTCFAICLYMAISNYMIYIVNIKIILYLTVFILQLIGSYLIYNGFIKEFKK